MVQIYGTSLELLEGKGQSDEGNDEDNGRREYGAGTHAHSDGTVARRTVGVGALGGELNVASGGGAVARAGLNLEGAGIRLYRSSRFRYSKCKSNQRRR